MRRWRSYNTLNTLRESSLYPRGSEHQPGYGHPVKGSRDYYYFIYIPFRDYQSPKQALASTTECTITAYSLKGALIKLWDRVFPKESFVKFCNKYKKEKGVNPRYEWGYNDFLNYLEDTEILYEYLPGLRPIIAFSINNSFTKKPYQFLDWVKKFYKKENYTKEDCLRFIRNAEELYESWWGIDLYKFFDLERPNED